jgi:hypothetical protein
LFNIPTADLQFFAAFVMRPGQDRYIQPAHGLPFGILLCLSSVSVRSADLVKRDIICGGSITVIPLF